MFDRILGFLLLIAFICPAAPSHAAGFRAFCDFRSWGANTGASNSLYESYMSKFAQQGVTALILINRESEPPFPRERRFLADAARRGVNVWIRTNRVSPKRGIQGRPNSTLDFALDGTLQRESLDYLLALAALSKEYPNLTGLVIGGEEVVGAHIDGAALNRYQGISVQQLGFSITGRLNDAQKIRYFDWVQNLQNDWYAKIWDTVKAQSPQMELFIYPSRAAVCGERFSRFPRPAYWDIYDLIVARQKHFSVILPSYTIDDPLGADLTAARAMYLRAATEASVPYFLLLQFHRIKNRTPTFREMEEQVLASINNGAAGVGFWPVDMDTRKDIAEADPQRFQDCFKAVAEGAGASPRTPQGSGLYVLKPRYSQYWEPDDQQTLKTFAILHRWGFAPEFLLAERVMDGPLPSVAKCFYLPETYKYERPEVWNRLQNAQKRIFFGQGTAEPFSPDKQPLAPLYELLGLRKGRPPGAGLAGGRQNFVASWKGSSYSLSLVMPLQPYEPTSDLTVASVKGPEADDAKGPFLAFSNESLIFLNAFDYGFLLGGGDSNQNRQFLKALLFN